jgi:hypothetical protein
MNTASFPSVPSLIIPLSQGNLILPQNLVAELIPLELHKQDKEPSPLDWLDLHGKHVPLISLPQLCGEQHTDVQAQQALVLHTLTVTENIPLLSLRVKGSPHHVDVDQQTLRDDHKENDKRCPYIAMHVRVANLPCMILDLPAIEKVVAGMLEQSP